jgi:AGCS family alanine or glycine:cation symporter
VINLIDLSFALMVIPNMIALFILAPKVNQAAKTYFNNRKNR